MTTPRQPTPDPGRRIAPSAITGPEDAAGLTEMIERGIVTGEFGPGDRLPPVRALADGLGLAPNTVAAAYRKLQDRGLLMGRGRRGTFVTDRGPADLNPADVANPSVPAGVVDLASGTPDPDLLPDLDAAVVATHRAEGQAPDLEQRSIGYGHDPVHPDLATALRSVGQGWSGLPEPRWSDDLAIVGGALDGIERTLAARLRPGDVVAVEDPTYPAVLALLAAMGLRPAPVAVDRFGPYSKDLRATLTTGAHAVIITPRAHNPTGAALDVERAAELTAVLKEFPGVLVIEDDYGGPVVGAEHHSVVPPDAPRWSAITSVAKSLGPDLRLAAVTGDRTTMARITDRQLLGTGWVSHILQRTAAALLTSSDITASLDRAASAYLRRREHLIGELLAHGVAATGRSGFNVWVPVEDETDVVAAMQAKGYAVRAGNRFRLQAAPGIRITSAAANLETLSDAASALATIVGRRTGGRSV